MIFSIVSNDEQREVLASLLDNIGYEIMPFNSVVGKVVEHVPKEVPLTVTTTGNRGLEPTLETSITLREKGYTVAPHIPARLVSGPKELDRIINRLEEANIDRVFMIAGDAKEPAGEFKNSLDMLKALHERGHHFSNIGIAGYPEGHAFFPKSDIDQALRDKKKYADRVLTQICFSADTFVEWSQRISSEGVDLPVYAGMPGPVNRAKLMRISVGLGLGPSANFLKKQENMFWKFFSPSGYNPNKLIKKLVARLTTTETTIRGFHIFTFNDLANTEKWRRKLLEQAKLSNAPQVKQVKS